jgi:hypothetical protein
MALMSVSTNQAIKIITVYWGGRKTALDTLSTTVFTAIIAHFTKTNTAIGTDLSGGGKHSSAISSLALFHALCRTAFIDPMTAETICTAVFE